MNGKETLQRATGTSNPGAPDTRPAAPSSPPDRPQDQQAAATPLEELQIRADIEDVKARTRHRHAEALLLEQKITDATGRAESKNMYDRNGRIIQLEALKQCAITGVRGTVTALAFYTGGDHRVELTYKHEGERKSMWLSNTEVKDYEVSKPL